MKQKLIRIGIFLILYIINFSIVYLITKNILSSILIALTGTICGILFSNKEWYLKAFKKPKEKLYTKEELKMALIYCVSELISYPTIPSTEMKIWNDKTVEWFEKNYPNS